MTSPFLWLAAVKCLKGIIKYLNSVAPEHRFVLAHAIEGEIWKITQVARRCVWVISEA